MEGSKFLNVFPKALKHLSSSTLFLILANVGVMLPVFYFMGAKHTRIGFHSDDYGFIYNGTFHSIQDIKRIFSNGDMISNADGLWDSSSPLHKPSFFESLYRPLLLLIMGSEHRIWGLNPYRFHLTHTGLHTIMTLLLLNIIACFSSLWIALPIALFFGFHSSLKDYFFWQCYIQNTCEALVGFFLVVAFFTWYYRRSRVGLIISLGLFFIILLLRETLIIFPVLVALWYLYNTSSDAPILSSLLKGCKAGLLFFLSILAYLSLRLWAQPLSFDIKNLGIKHFNETPGSSWQHLKLIAGDRLTWLMDLIGLKWLANGTALLKGSALLLLFLAIFYGWQKTPYKVPALISMTAILLTSWPSLLLVHCSRYLYLPVYFFSLTIGFLAAGLSIQKKIIVGTLFLVYACLQTSITVPCLTDWCIRTGEEQRLLKEIAEKSNGLGNQESLMVIGLPSRLFGTGSRAGIKLLGGEQLHRIHFFLPYYTRWEEGLTASPHYTQEGNSFFIFSPCPDTTWFEISQSGKVAYGHLEITRTEKGRVIAVQFIPSLSPAQFFFPRLIFSAACIKELSHD